MPVLSPFAAVPVCTTDALKAERGGKGSVGSIREAGAGRSGNLAMPSAHYPGFQSDYRSSGRWDRAVRTLVVAAVAILVGAVAGGASVFAIVSVLSGDHRQEGRTVAQNRSEPTAPATADHATTPRQVQPEPKSATVSTPDTHPASDAAAASVPAAAPVQTPEPAAAPAPTPSSAEASAPPAATEGSSPSRSEAALRDTPESVTHNGHGKRARRSREYGFDSGKRPATAGADRTAARSDDPPTRRAKSDEPVSEPGVAPSSAAPGETASASRNATSAKQHGPYWDYFGDTRSRTSRPAPRHTTTPHQEATTTSQAAAAEQPPSGDEAPAANASTGGAGQAAEAQQRNGVGKKSVGASSSSHVARRSRTDNRHAVQQQPVPAVPRRRLVTIPQRAEDAAQAYPWSEREPWGYRERWGGGFFGRDNWRDYWD